MKIYVVSEQEDGNLVVDELEAIERSKQYWLNRKVNGFGWVQRISKDNPRIKFNKEDAIQDYENRLKKYINENTTKINYCNDMLDKLKAL